MWNIKISMSCRWLGTNGICILIYYKPSIQRGERLPVTVLNPMYSYFRILLALNMILRNIWKLFESERGAQTHFRAQKDRFISSLLVSFMEAPCCIIKSLHDKVNYRGFLASFLEVMVVLQGCTGCFGSAEVLLQANVDDSCGSDREAAQLQQFGEKWSWQNAAITEIDPTFTGLFRLGGLETWQNINFEFQATN